MSYTRVEAEAEIAAVKGTTAAPRGGAGDERAFQLLGHARRWLPAAGNLERGKLGDRLAGGRSA